MAPKTEVLTSLRVLRQLRRTRGFYMAGVLLWTAAAVWTGWVHPGSRQMWVSLLLAAVFAGLLGTASAWLYRLRAAQPRKPVHHAARGTSAAAG
ncbi:hypothetical protein [Streptomyces sp. NPDC057694]|uniref:hypothetical protein n=1 Tax=Streptomyces sp. NPDC057694 TaxID=3346216 RepID=UPI0036C7D1B4